MKFVHPIFGTLTIALGLVGQVQAQSLLTNGLVAYYPFDGNANDASGNGNDGTVLGATLTVDRFGVANHAYLFNGVDSMVRFPETLFGPTNAAWTVSAWVTTGSGPYVNNQLVFSKGSYNGGAGLGIISNYLYFGVHVGYPQTDPQVYTPARLNSVMHLVGVYEKGQSISFYVDGILRTNEPVSSDSLTVLTGFPLLSSIGAYDYTPGPYAFFQGIIDDVRVYTRALSPSEVQQLYQFESPPAITLIKAVKPSLHNLTVGTNYQLQVSTDLNSWTNQGSVFTATNTAMVYPQYFDVENWGELFFRLQVGP
jgi:hypothetical protein